MATVTAFTVESLQWLRAGDEQATVAFLGDAVKLLNSTNAQGTVAERNPEDFVPQNYEIVVNQLWFLSMIISLSAVVVGTLAFQWLSVFRSNNVKNKLHDEALALRQLRYEGLMAWGIPHIPAVLLLAVQCALVPFGIGLVYFLWSVNKRVGVPVTLACGALAVLFIYTAILPFLQSVLVWLLPQSLVIPQCPFKSPISWVIHRGCILLGVMGVICSFPLGWLPRFKHSMQIWRRQQLSLLTDYSWHGHDDLWRRRREHWELQSSNTASTRYWYYLIRGFASAMERVVPQPSDAHAILTCFQDFHGTTGAEIFETLFGRKINLAEEALLTDRTRFTTEDGVDGSSHLSSPHLRNLRRDFLSAHVLQHFVARNQRLHRALLAHRVELYIRIKNSTRNTRSQFSRWGYNEDQFIGSSLDCPIECIGDAETLSFGAQHYSHQYPWAQTPHRSATAIFEFR